MIENKEHHMVLRNKDNMELTGVIKIISVNNNEFLLKTQLGKMYIFGSNLEINNLALEKGQVGITGNVSAIEYEDYTKNTTKKSFISKLFK